MTKFLLILFILVNVAHAEDVKLFSWNIFMLPKPIKFSLQAERTDLIVDLIKKSGDDVIILQEAFSGDFRAKLNYRTSKIYPYQYYLNRKFFSFDVYGSGVYYLSRYPMKVLSHTYYSDCTKADCFASKGSALIEITLPSGKAFQIAGTHLQAGQKELSREIRMKQLEQVKSLLSASAKKNVPQFLIGDLNLDALNNPDYLKGLHLMNMSSGPLEGDLSYTNGFPITCYEKPGDDKKEWLDHIWLKPNESLAQVFRKKVRPHIGTIEGMDCPLSDHWAIEAILSI
jgi:endonuclease/exonuclease/phosphatase family metal-dependent hydrolase